MLIVIFSPLNMQQHKSQKGMHLPQIIKCAEMWTGGVSKEPSKYQPSLQPSLILKKVGMWEEKRDKGVATMGDISILIRYSLM